jgi:UDP-2,3-diacylglucosamine pyrophosphatase LpxH
MRHLRRASLNTFAEFSIHSDLVSQNVDLMPKHDELHVISDLHMGGNDPKFQIFDQGPLLASFIDSLTAKPASRNVALCINGDTVDFLAETSPAAKYLDPKYAIKKLDRIMKDASFRAVWKALAQFVQTKNRTLILTLGNNDLELALPWVGEFLTEKLTGGHASASGRLEFCFDGQGYRCKVGKSEVFCIHGNDVDTWNITDYEALRRLGRDFESGRVNSWSPNAGTRMVIDVMNEVKRKYPFIDLLKPEKAGLAAILYALDPSISSAALQSPAILGQLAWDKLRRTTGFLADDDDDGDSESRCDDSPPPAMLNPKDKLELRTSKRATADELLLTSNLQFEDGSLPRDLLSGVDSDSTLGMISAFVSWARGRDKVEVLREALENMGEFQGFDLKHLDDCFRDIDKLASDDIDFVITGHTHQEKALCRQQGEGFYYNGGTWVRLMRLEPDVLKSERRFRRIYASIATGTLEALDKTPGLVMRRPAVVSVEANGNTTKGSLKRPRLNGTQLHLETVERSESERSKR